MSMLFLLIIPTCLTLVASFSVEQQAFTLPKVGFRLKGTELKSKRTPSTFFCANDCVRMRECSAYNYVEENGTCQLMDTNDLAESEPDPDYQIVLKKITCIDNPCMHGGTCHDVPTSVNDIKGYKCTCPCGRCGHNCSKCYQKVVSPKECMSFCWDTPGCRSADYINSEGACWLNSVTGDEEPLTMDCDKWYPGVAYLFFNCTCDA